MDRQEQVQNLAKIARISVSYAEDLYDSFFPKPVVPQFVADWYEGNKEYLDYNIWEFIKHWDNQPEDEFKKWMYDDDKKPILTLVNMDRFGYEVEKETRYTVRIKGVDQDHSYLNCNESRSIWFLSDVKGYSAINTHHNRKDLEANGFGWVFDCPGVEVKKVE